MVRGIRGGREMSMQGGRLINYAMDVDVTVQDIRLKRECIAEPALWSSVYAFR